MSNGDEDYDEVDRDREHFVKTLCSFRFFGLHLMKKIESKKAYFESLPNSQRKLLGDFCGVLQRVESCVAHNNALIKTMIEHSAPDIFNGDHNQDVLNAFDQSSLKSSASLRKSFNRSTSTKFGPFAFTTTDVDKVRSTLKQFVRDWSSLGKDERDACYGPVIRDICRIYNPSKCDPREVRILVPGAGLGRLAWELAHRGYACQGNEWSLHMLIPAYFILNNCKEMNEHKLYPWVSQFCNNMSREDQLAPVSFPDVSPADISPDVPFSMAAGDFVDIYTDPDCWDCVATVFFIDTAHNILNYLETIWKILKPGGHWINFGPLLYHFSDIPGEESLELTFDELQLAIRRIGFEILKEEKNIRCTYTQNPASMLSYDYSCVYGIYKKPADVGNISKK